MNTLALRKASAPAFDALVIDAFDCIPRGTFEALGSTWRSRLGRLAADPLPAWTERVRINSADFSALTEMVKPDQPEQGAPAPVANGGARA